MEKLVMFLMVISLAICLAKNPSQRPLNIGHRGSSGRLPEHTIEAYRLAIKEGADYIECDVCITKDLIPVCRHESWLNESTNIWQNKTLRSRLTTHNIDNKTITDIFTVDLTLEELQGIRVWQKYTFRDPNLNDMYKIPTVEEYIKVAKMAGRPVGIYPEIKNPEWVNSLYILKKANTTFEDILVDLLHKHGYNEKDAPCLVQSFSKESIKALAKKTKLPLVMLYEWPIANEEAEFRDISRICYGIGVWKNMIIPVNNKKYLQDTTNLVTKAHKYNMKIHAYTFRNEDRYLAWNYTQDPVNEYQTFLDTHIDGYFTDFPGTLKRFLDVKYNTNPSPKHCENGANQIGSFVMLFLVVIAARM